ncbi:unnamed protein product [Arabidopsis lyrata]|nr:unnamed protein product [Arabidopsis lyrata]
MEEWTTLNHNTNLETAEEASRGGRQVLRWLKPPLGILKCNIHASWVSVTAHCGGAWILRNHLGNALFHARDAFLPRMNRLSTELHCLLWCLRSLHDLHINNCEIWSDCNAAVMALENPLEWPKYRSQPDKILQAIRISENATYDCVDIFKQPGLNHPLLQNNTIQMKPSISRTELRNHIGNNKSYSKKTGCPDGTVPILRNSNEYNIKA